MHTLSCRANDDSYDIDDDDDDDDHDVLILRFIHRCTPTKQTKIAINREDR